MASLDRAFAFQHAECRVAVADDLELDVSRPLKPRLDVDRVVAEGAGGLGAGRGERGGQVGLAGDPDHADAAAPGGRLEHCRKPGLADRFLGGVEVDQDAGARMDGKSRPGHRPAGPGLVAQGLDPLGGRADEADAGALHGAGEVGVFGQETVARMQGVAVGPFGGLDQPRCVEVRVLGAVARQAGGRGGLGEVGRRGVDVRVRGHAVDAEFAAGADHASCDGGAVGDEDPFKHAR